MTNERAIEILKCDFRGYNDISDEKTAVSMAVSALKKQIPKKPLYDEYTGLYLCPNCKKLTSYALEDFSDYCELCGQALDGVMKNEEI